MKKTLHLLSLLLLTLLPLGAKAATTTTDFVVDGVTYQYYHNKPWIGSATEYVWVPSQAGYSTTLGRITSINTNTSLTGEIEVKSQVEYNGKTWDVTKIDAYAFGGCVNITKITLPSSITDITTKSISGGLILDELDNALYSITGSGMFMGCTSLKEAVVNCNVTSLGGGAFVGCSNLTNVTLPTTLTTIDFGEFCECPKLTSIDNIDQLTNLTTIGHYAFYQYTTPNTTLKTLNFPGNTITGIGYGAFRNCQGLTTLTGIENVSSFNSYMLLLSGYQFSNCYALKELKFTNRSLTSIPEACFSNCQNLTSLTLPNSITSIADYGFNATWRLRHITWLDSNGNSLNDEEDLFYIPSTWTKANKYVCRSMGINSTGVRLYVPSNFSSADSYAFANVKWIDGSVSEATTPPSIESDAFSTVSDANKTLMYVPSGCVEAYEASTWANTFRFEVNPEYLDKSWTDNQGVLYSLDPASAEAWVEVQGTVTYDSNGKVDDITGSTTLASEIEIPATFVHDNITYTVVGIKAMAFARCNTVKSVTFPSTIKAITTGTIAASKLGVDITGADYITVEGSAMFLDNESIQSVTFQDENLTTVGGGAFAKCPALTTVTLPASVTEISLGQFAESSLLSTINNLTNVTEVGDFAFYNTKNDPNTALTSIAFNAEKLTRIGTSAFYYCTKLSSITGIENVSDFGSDNTTTLSVNPGYVFANCYELNNVVLKNQAITSIPQYAFSQCTKMTSLTLPASVTSLKTYSLNNCYVLKHITWVDADGQSVNDEADLMFLPDGLTSIGSYAFRNVAVNGSNPGLLVSFPSTITNYSALSGAGIASNAFAYTEGITSYKFLDGCVSYATTAPSVASTAFPTYAEADKALLYIPAGSLSSYESSNWANAFRFEEIGTVGGIKYELNSTTAEAWVEVQGEAE
ncbi:MAG: leucine-rich repeat domain-containing protein [Bacteroidales bacterium]|nr:leucine-rich repeat domain-containing protein [Bacteroidales bacterium]